MAMAEGGTSMQPWSPAVSDESTSAMAEGGASMQPWSPAMSCEAILAMTEGGVTIQPWSPAVSDESTSAMAEGDGAASLGKTSIPLKATEDILFRCCSCTYVSRDQRGILGDFGFTFGDFSANRTQAPLCNKGGTRDVVSGLGTRHQQKAAAVGPVAGG
ncbi:zinc finger protein 782 [Ixodes scapularis]